jgi:hypothetical protein
MYIPLFLRLSEYCLLHLTESILSQRINRVKLGSFVGGHKAERDADCGGADHCADDGSHGNAHREVGDKVVENQTDAGRQQYAGQTADDTD